MKFIAIVFLALIAALAPFACGSFLVDELVSRANIACERAGINERPLIVHKGYLESQISLDEPLSTTISSLGLEPEVVDFLREYNLKAESDVYHNPYKGLLGKAETRVLVDGPNWKIEGTEELLKKFNGAEESKLTFGNVLAEDGALLICFSNCFSVSQKAGFFGDGLETRETKADLLVLSPFACKKAALFQSKNKTEREIKLSFGALSYGESFSASNLTLNANIERDGKKAAVDVLFSALTKNAEKFSDGNLKLQAEGLDCEELLEALRENKFSKLRPSYLFSEGAALEGTLTTASGNVSLHLKINGSIPDSFSELLANLEGELKIQGKEQKLLESFFKNLPPSGDGAWLLQIDKGKVTVNGVAL